MADPFFDYCMAQATGGGLKPGDHDEIGDVYRAVLHQRGFGMNWDMVPGQIYGLGFADFFAKLFRSARPFISQGLKHVGSVAVDTAANVARDVIQGENVADSAKNHVGSAVEGLVDDVFARAPGVVNGLAGSRDVYKAGRKRGHVSRPSPGKLVASARHPKNTKRARKSEFNLRDYPGLRKLL